MAGEKKGKRKIFFTVDGKGDKLDGGRKVSSGKFNKRTRGLKARVITKT